MNFMKDNPLYILICDIVAECITPTKNFKHGDYTFNPMKFIKLIYQLDKKYNGK